MNRRALAARLSLIVALAGLLPLAGLGAFGIDLLRRRTERASEENLSVIAEQVGGRVDGFLEHQRELVRAVAAVATPPQAERRLEEVVLDAPSLGRVTLVSPQTAALVPAPQWPTGIWEMARAGQEVTSDVYLADDSTPAMDVCTPARALPGHLVCARLDLLELWRLVQRIQVGRAGYALAFDGKGRLLASGAGASRGAIFTGTAGPQSRMASRAAAGPSGAPVRYVGAAGKPVISGGSKLKEGWTVVVEQPVEEVLRSARAAQWALGSVLLLALLLSVGVGALQSQRVLGELEVEERWRTAGRIAAGITHDLGHRLRILQQTVRLVEAGDAAFLPRIQDNLRTEVATLQKFVADFSDLSRDVRGLELYPLELGAFMESIRRTALPHAKAAGIALEVRPLAVPLWVMADRHLMERALLNLIGNAVEASESGAHVRICAATLAGDNILEVNDFGSGIPAARLPLLFDAFHSTKRTGAHIGMGLANVKRIVEAHSGRVRVSSTEGKGTRFQVVLKATTPPPTGDPRGYSSSASFPKE